MSFDIYGNRLERGFCEVHPHVRQEYPCDLCMNERQRQTVASYPKCGICGKFESCADSCGVPVCSEGCDHEAKRRNGEVDGLRAALTAERERADALMRRLVAIEDEHVAYADDVGDALGQGEDEPLLTCARRVVAERDALRERVARLVGAIACARDLTTIMRMPNIEHVADAHNAAVAKLRTALEGK